MTERFNDRHSGQTVFFFKKKEKKAAPFLLSSRARNVKRVCVCECMCAQRQGFAVEVNEALQHRAYKHTSKGGTVLWRDLPGGRWFFPLFFQLSARGIQAEAKRLALSRF